jgi:hypothetical protein
MADQVKWKLPVILRGTILPIHPEQLTTENPFISGSFHRIKEITEVRLSPHPYWPCSYLILTRQQGKLSINLREQSLGLSPHSSSEVLFYYAVAQAIDLLCLVQIGQKLPIHPSVPKLADLYQRLAETWPEV